MKQERVCFWSGVASSLRPKPLTSMSRLAEAMVYKIGPEIRKGITRCLLLGVHASASAMPSADRTAQPDALPSLLASSLL